MTLPWKYSPGVENEMRAGKNKLGSEEIKKEGLHWVMRKDDMSLVSRKSRLVKKREEKPASGFGIFFHRIVKFL